MNKKSIIFSIFCLLALVANLTWSQSYYEVVHKPTGYKFYSCSNANGTSVTAMASLSDDNCGHWEQVPVGSYFHLKNRASQKHIRPSSLEDGANIVLQPNTWKGNWTQFTFVDRGDGFGHIVNRATGKHVFVPGLEAGESLQQQPSTWRGNYTQWRFDLVNQFQPDTVTLTQSSWLWDTFDYSLTNEYAINNFDHSSIVQRSYTTWILENNFLKVTLLPEFGGRILSMVNKVTGSETLYQNPVGTPYLIGSGIFYYDWLMIQGGIFPTFPEAEHGKSWNRVWDFDIVSSSEEEITVSMSYTDSDAYSAAPFRYMRGATNLQATYLVTLSAHRAALDTEIRLENPTNNDVSYEYWTNTTLAPGSQEGDSRATDGLEIIAPINLVSIDYGFGVSQWDDIKWFVNHSEEGIAYANPNMQGANFWGAINHDVEEGIFRVADNHQTPGLKIWTFGYDSVSIDPYADGTEWHRPAIELWAGVTNRFFQKQNFPANSSVSIAETYSPSSGLSNVTHANREMLVDLNTGGVSIYFMQPDEVYRVFLRQQGVIIYDEQVRPNLITGNHILLELLPGVELVIENSIGERILSSTL